VFANGAVTAAMAYAFNHLSGELADGYDSQASNYHDYEEPWFELCSMSQSWCTLDNGYDALKHYAYPGQDHQSPVVDQGVYRVTALGMELGDMTVTLSPETHSIFNVTAENHIMYDGHVQRQLVVRDGSIYVRTHGAGNNRGFWFRTPGKPPVYVPGSVAAQINQRLGPIPFRSLNDSMLNHMRPSQ